MKTKLASIITVTLLHGVASSQTKSVYGSPESYPVSTDLSSCRNGQFRRFCDPEDVLNDAEKDLIGKVLALDRSSKCANENVDVQYAVALLRKMDFKSDLPLSPSDISRYTEEFARKIHNKWGVGLESECGGTGVLIFLARDNRSLYISRGAALERIFTNRRLDKIIEKMKRDLQKQQYGVALVGAIRGLDDFLSVGEPSLLERTEDFFVIYGGLILILGFFAFAARSMQKQEQERREYAKVASQLSKMDQARAEALQGRFKAESCPICLENFQLCKKTDELDSSTCSEMKETRRGADGLPIRLLRCGHVFCDSCFVQWVTTGKGKVDKCPICQQDVGSTADVVVRPGESDIRRRAGSTNEHPDPEGNAATSTSDEPPTEAERTHAMRAYIRDRNFRLMQLGARYPRYIRPQQIQRWSSETYDGALAHDPTFVISDPVRTVVSSPTTSGRNSTTGVNRSGFGGGTSSGGRSGRW